MNATTIRVFHTTNLGDAYVQSTQEAIEVFTYATDTPDPLAACEEEFDLFNIGHDPVFGEPSVVAVAYRGRHNRSLSIGDLVAVGEEFFECRPSAGWTRREALPTLSEAPLYGSTWYYGPIPTEHELRELALRD